MTLQVKDTKLETATIVCIQEEETYVGYKEVLILFSYTAFDAINCVLWSPVSVVDWISITSAL